MTVYVILRLAVLVELRLVTDGQTAGQTRGHTALTQYCAVYAVPRSFYRVAR